MKIVFATPRVPYPPNRGDRVRSRQQTRHLARRHELHVVCLAERDADWEGEAALRDMCASVAVIELDGRRAARRVARALAGGGSLAAAWLGEPRLRRAALDAAGADADLLWICNGALLPLLGDVPARRRVVDLVDADSEKWRQLADSASGPRAWLYRREARLTREQENGARRWADRCTVVSAAEAALFASMAPELSPPLVLPATVDVEPTARAAVVAAPRLLFTGTLDYAPNLDAVHFFAAEVLPLLRRDVGAASLTVVGARPPARARRWARRFGFDLAADVADVRPYFAAARACVAPLRLGRGTQIKVLEAMAHGVPVVATPRALEGLAHRNEEVALCADTAAALARACAAVLTDDAIARRLGAAGHRFATARHSSQVSDTAIDELLAELGAGDRPATQAGAA